PTMPIYYSDLTRQASPVEIQLVFRTAKSAAALRRAGHASGRDERTQRSRRLALDDHVRRANPVEGIHLPIRPYLSGRRFAPETIAAMNAAFAEACKTLNINAETPSQSMRAQVIISLVEHGTADAETLGRREPRFMKM